MRVPIFIILLLIDLGGPLGSLTQSSFQGLSSRKSSKRTIWRPAAFRGLIVGKSQGTQIFKILGQPDSEYAFDPKAAPEGAYNAYIYNSGGEFPGEFTVVVDRKSHRILTMTLDPHDLSKARAVEHFGPHYSVAKYDFCQGSEDSEDGTIFESNRGELTFIEYRSLGLALLIGATGLVDQIRYVAEPIGLTSRGLCKRTVKKRGMS